MTCRLETVPAAPRRGCPADSRLTSGGSQTEQRIHLGQRRSQRTTIFRVTILGGACLSCGVFWIVFRALPIDRALPVELQHLGDRLNPSHPLVALTVNPEPLATPYPTTVPAAAAQTSSPQPAALILPTSTPLGVPTPALPSASPTAGQRASTYTVQPGDTLYSIARRNKISPQALAELNDLPSTAMVKVGQKLRLP